MRCNFNKAILFYVFLSLLLLSFQGCKDKNSVNKDLLQNIQPDTVITLSCEKPVNILFLGDLYFGERYQDKSRYNLLKTKGYAYSYRLVKKLISGSDYSIANLEATLSTYSEKDKASRFKKYLHYSDTLNAPLHLNELTINAVSLANNHTMDFSWNGLFNTFYHLHKQDIAFFGAGLNQKDAAKPLMITFQQNGVKKNIYFLGCFEYKPVHDIFLSFYAKHNMPGVNPLHIKKIARNIRLIKKTDPNAFVIVSPHWGKNYQWKSKSQTEIAHELISAGADLVIGHGAHRVQEIEQFKGKYIFYSIGNSIFNSPGRYERKNSIPYSLIVKLELTNKDPVLKCYPIMSNNRKTNYSPYLLNKKQTMELYDSLEQRKKINFEEIASIKKDSYGYYLLLK